MNGLGTGVLIAAIACGALAVQASPRPLPQQAPTFRAVTDVVTIPVSVRAGDAPVTGLTAADFIVTDRQIEQRIERVDSESLPIDVTLIVDTSGSTDQVLGNIRDDAREIASVLRAQDRLQLLTIDTYATEVLPLQSMTPAVSFDRLVTSGLSSVHDAMALAMLVRGQPERRRLVVAMTDGVDSISALGAGALKTIGQVSDAVLEIFLIDTITERRERMIFKCLMAGLCGPDKRFWLPFQDRDVEPLKQAATATGGDLRTQGFFRDRSAVGMFKQAFDDFRRSYFIRYSPRGVARQGWHPVEVRLRARQGAPSRVVRARPGYFIGVRPPDAPSLPPLGAGALPATLPEFLRAYEQGDFSAVSNGLAAAADIVSILAGFRTGGNPWPETRRREAVFALELAEAGLHSPQPGAREAAVSLLTWYRGLVRPPLEPDNFERLWYWAEIALLESVVEPGRPSAAIENALQRFPGDPQFLLARAVGLDQKFHPGTLDFPEQESPDRLPAPEQAAEIIDAYKASAVSAETRFEARVRLALLLHRLGRYPEALDALRIENPRDKQFAYLHSLVSGKVLEAQGRLDDALQRYQLALGTWPAGQSARIAIRTMAMRRGDRTTADAMSDAIAAQPADAFDPFWQYWQGDAPFYASIRQSLRQLMR